MFFSNLYDRFQFANVKALRLLICSFIAITVVGDAVAQNIERVGPIEKVGPIERVGPLKPIGPIDLDPINSNADSSNPKVRTNGYLACWTEDIRAQKPMWQCSKQYVDNSRQAYEFTEYKRWQYPAEKGGDAFMFSIQKVEWEDADSRKKVMDRIEREVLPAYVKRKTKADLEWIELKWIDLKPVLSTEELQAYKDGRVLKTNKGDKSAAKTEFSAVGWWQYVKFYNGEEVYYAGGFKLLDDNTGYYVNSDGKQNPGSGFKWTKDGNTIVQKHSDGSSGRFEIISSDRVRNNNFKTEHVRRSR